MVKVGYIAPHTYPSPYEICATNWLKKKKKGISRQAMSSWKQDSLVISTEPKPKRTENSRHTIHLFKPDLPNQGSSLPILINSSAPSNWHAESPSSATVDGSCKALGLSNPLIAWGCISVTVAKFSPKLELYYFTIQKSAGFLKELTANHLLTLSNLISPNCHQKIWLWNKYLESNSASGLTVNT